MFWPRDKWSKRGKEGMQNGKVFFCLGDHVTTCPSGGFLREEENKYSEIEIALYSGECVEQVR